MVNWFFQRPLLLLVVLGGLIFSLHALVSGNREGRDIHLDAAAVTAMISSWQQQFGRSPNEEELTRLIDNWIREEMLYREALHLHLDRDDIIIRRRLTQKLGFFMQQLDGKPDEDDVRDFYRTEHTRYQQPETYDFSQLFFSDEHRDQQQRIERARQRLRLGEEVLEADIFMLNRDYARQSRPQIERLFGAAFAEVLVGLPLAEWVGPIRSGYGQHLVVLRGRIDATQITYEAARPQVLKDYSARQRERKLENYTASLRADYRVVVEPPYDRLMGEGN